MKLQVVQVLVVVALMASLCKAGPELSGACPLNWEKFGSSCYFFNTHKTSWDCANTICKQVGGDLASIESAEENTFILDIINKEGGCDNGMVWIGLNDKETEGTFIWTSSNKPITFNGWNGGEPNGSGNENCVEIKLSAGVWNDLSCNQPCCYICEKPQRTHI
ncbi:perlucin-like protein [Patiria miniata]|uniref:C-type lectin domain-containing protein n=1 Tax=Patiria miniata TaxID=46514 RepID=A0A914A3P2_PATMI|nr:perlucin-like protein [Patiria miniata]